MREEEGRERVAEDDGFLNGVGGAKSWQFLFTLLEDEGKKKLKRRSQRLERSLFSP